MFVKSTIGSVHHGELTLTSFATPEQSSHGWHDDRGDEGRDNRHESVFILIIERSWSCLPPASIVSRRLNGKDEVKGTSWSHLTKPSVVVARL
jgi:hypothetical protein